MYSVYVQVALKQVEGRKRFTKISDFTKQTTYFTIEDISLCIHIRYLWISIIIFFTDKCDLHFDAGPERLTRVVLYNLPAYERK